MKKKYKLVLWCPDCTNTDFQGCFDGGIDESYFDDFEDAKSEGLEKTSHTILNFEIWEKQETGDYKKILDM